ncbi:MAG: hypothetical protein IJQ67_05205 [Bacilli bacterium]|nr:hypothetical protein [Bacilli bacterium]
MNKEKTLRLYQEVKRALKNRESSFSSTCFFLKNDKVLCLDKEYGDSRHPYSFDGLTLWAYASGYITINEAAFYVIPTTLEGKEPYLAFFGGIKDKKGYRYLSITGVSDTEYGNKAEKYCVFTPEYALYLRKIDNVLFSLQISINNKKEIIYSLDAWNLGKNKKTIYVSSYINPLLTHSNYESEETKWFRKAVISDDGALLSCVEDLSRSIHLHNYLLIRRVSDQKDIQCTSSRMYYVGNKNTQLSNSSCLRDGEFKNHRSTTQFIDMACYGDLIKTSGDVHAFYKLSIAYSNEELKLLDHSKLSLEDDEFDIKKDNPNDKLKIRFNNFKNSDLSSDLFNQFIRHVNYQVDYCSKAKNSSLMLLGVRDISQMIEASLIWNKELAREKIKYILDYIDMNGRASRQFSPSNEQGLSKLDTREFIDQGQWIISLVYKYLCYTGDVKILKEKCSFCHIFGEQKGYKYEERTSVYDHLKRIINYLVSHIDKDNGCLHILYGDWNDAVDGLGKGENTTDKFSNGVSSMATFHLYKNLEEFIEIASLVNEDTSNYLKIKEDLYQSIIKHLFVRKGDEVKIVHGWGEDKSFYVGSFDDVDHKDRDSAASNAFYVLSGIYQRNPEYKPYVLKAFKRLDSKYGIRTFDVPFYPEDASRVGRIVNLPPGTAENAATYIHASLFSIKALLEMNEGEFAFDQLYKVIPLTHEFISTSPYVMPNSYGYNPDLGVDGQSMNDWYTGSSNTLIKAIVDDIFGIKVNIRGELTINPCAFPVESASITLPIRSKIIEVKYSNHDLGHREIYIDGLKSDNNLINLKDYTKKKIVVEVKE